MADTRGDVLVPYERFVEHRERRVRLTAEAVRLSEQRTLDGVFSATNLPTPGPVAAVGQFTRSDSPASFDERHT